MILDTLKSKNTPIFIGGASRSGTTLVRVILDSHPRIYCGPELAIGAPWFQLYKNMKVYSQYGFLNKNIEELRTVFRNGWLEITQECFVKSNKARLAEKTPSNCFHFDIIHELFPESPVIHVIRDGRDVVCSLLSQNWIDLGTGEIPSYTQDPVKACELWKNMVSAGLNKKDILGKNYIEIRYEDLIKQPDNTLRLLMSSIDENYYPELLEFHTKKRNLADEASAKQVNKALYKTSKSRWKREFDRPLAETFDQICGKLLIQLGYEINQEWVNEIT